MLLLASLAAAAPPYVRPTRLGVEPGVDLGWLVGGNGAGFRAGAGQSLAFSVATGTATALRLEVGHEHHVLGDAGAWFVDVPAPADALSGGRDTITLAAGARVGVDTLDEAGLPSRRLRVYPGAHGSLGLAAWRARLATVGLDGATALDASGVQPRLEVGAGAELRVGAHLSVLPHLDVAVTLARDPGEVDGKDAWGIEARIAPALDARVGF